MLFKVNPQKGLGMSFSIFGNEGTNSIGNFGKGPVFSYEYICAPKTKAKYPNEIWKFDA